MPSLPKNPKTKLTNKRVNALPLPVGTTQCFHWDSDTKGFGARITAGGARSWIAESRVSGKKRRFTIGPCDLIRADEARKRATAVLLDMYDNIDPQVKKQKKRFAGKTLINYGSEYVDGDLRGRALRPATQQDILDCADKHFKDWANKPLSLITVDMCVKRFEEISARAPVQANRSFRSLRSIFNYAREQSRLDDGTYTLNNPVTQMFCRGGRARWNPEKPRTERIPKNKIGSVWLALEQYSDPDNNSPATCTSSDLVAFILLTGARKGESSQLTWDRVYLDAPIPYFHFDVTKNHNPISLPINYTLRIVLERRQRLRKPKNNFVFPAEQGKNGFLKNPNAVMRKLSKVAETHLYPHCLRRTFDDIAQFAGVDSDQRRQLLNHISGDVHSRSYSNNPDPEMLLDASQKVGSWIDDQAKLSKMQQFNISS